jgi:uncharacterized protein (DUF2062 family)
MIYVTKALVRKWVTLLLHTHDSPRRTAAAFALGVFWGFSPLIGLHTVLAVLLAFTMGLNRLAAIAGAYVNLPWFYAPYYTLATVVGAKVLGVPLLAPFAVGSTLGAGLLAVIAYWLSVPAIVAGRRHLHLPHRHAHPEERP